MTARENSSGRSSSPAAPRGGRFQFGMRGLMATVVLLCVPFAIWGGLLRADGKDKGDSQLVIFVLLCVGAPMGMMLLLAALNAAARVYRALRPRNHSAEDEDDFLSSR